MFNLLKKINSLFYKKFNLISIKPLKTGMLLITLLFKKVLED